LISATTDCDRRFPFGNFADALRKAGRRDERRRFDLGIKTV
jgi:hypothetical protein